MRFSSQSVPYRYHLPLGCMQGISNFVACIVDVFHNVVDLCVCQWAGSVENGSFLSPQVTEAYLVFPNKTALLPPEMLM